MNNLKNRTAFVKLYHQPGAKIGDENANINCFGENLNFNQLGNGFWNLIKESEKLIVLIPSLLMILQVKLLD